jgi:hypothetical protein
MKPPFFTAGQVRARDGTIEEAAVTDIAGERRPEAVVIVRSAGTAGCLSAHAFAIDKQRLVFLVVRASIRSGWKGGRDYELGSVMSRQGPVRAASKEEVGGLLQASLFSRLEPIPRRDQPAGPARWTSHEEMATRSSRDFFTARLGYDLLGAGRSQPVVRADAPAAVLV